MDLLSYSFITLTAKSFYCFIGKLNRYYQLRAKLVYLIFLVQQDLKLLNYYLAYQYQEIILRINFNNDRLPVLFAKFDEIRDAGDILPTAVLSFDGKFTYTSISIKLCFRTRSTDGNA